MRSNYKKKVHACVMKSVISHRTALTTHPIGLRCIRLLQRWRLHDASIKHEQLLVIVTHLHF